MKWSQYVSGVVGLGIVLLAAVVHLRAKEPIDGPRAPRVLPAFSLALVIALAGVVGAVSAASSIPSGFDSMAFHGVVNSLIVLAAGLLIMTLAWRVAVRTTGRAE